MPYPESTHTGVEDTACSEKCGPEVLYGTWPEARGHSLGWKATETNSLGWLRNHAASTHYFLDLNLKAKYLITLILQTYIYMAYVYIV